MFGDLVNSCVAPTGRTKVGGSKRLSREDWVNLFKAFHVILKTLVLLCRLGK